MHDREHARALRNAQRRREPVEADGETDAVVPRLIHLAATGQLARAVADFPQDAEPNAQLAYQLLIQCSEPWASWRPAEIDRLATGTDFEPLYQLDAKAVAGQLGLRCAQDLTARFVFRGTAAGLDTSCADYAALQPFDTRR